ncbi:Transcription factor Sox-19b [Ooceraea biroi]|uniref:Sex-determining region Y protein n=1 Tax=Ooceraea biroi TaxID=2015173 RepID=A0A026WS00_OOCBI|nr:Transcription factor Sox-19b [Ooceraea biroi]
MESDESVSRFAEKNEASEICKRERRTRDRTDRGKIIVVVSAAETKPPASNKKLKKKIDDDVSLCNVTSSVHSVRMKDSVDEDGKENTGEKRIPSESKLSRGNCETDKIFPQQQQRTRANRSPRRESAAIPTLLCIDDRLVDAAATGVKPKIPRPANAFMLFANEWRRKLAAENPRESNKDISVRLVVQKQSIFWKNMSKDVKEKYFALAREVDKEHKRKYPDYVYNPKEARLRKAMREQTRELSRRSILQSAIANANARTAAIGGTVSASMAGNFLNQHHRFDCSSVPMSSNVDPHQRIEPWFQAVHRPKLVHSPRIGDWYGNMDDGPIERLQAMGAIHQQQRDLDRSIKDQRTQAAECAVSSFASNGYLPAFAVAEREIRRQESTTEYVDFVDGQKWHPYQNSASPHPHARTSHPSPQMSGILHPNVQSTNAHGHAHGLWGQFCHGVLPHMPTMACNAAIRGPRHAVFLRDRTPTRHRGFLEDVSQMVYAPDKMHIGIRASYPPSDHRMPRLLESTVESVVDSTTATARREEKDGIRWERKAVTTAMSLDELVPTSMEGTVSREKERGEARHSSERFEPKRKSVPRLPGFHQAFGSTEIGRFSRSKFFVNMVGESGNGGDVSDGGDGGDRDVSREHSLLKTMESAVARAAAAAAAATATATVATAAAAAAVVATTIDADKTFDADDNREAFAIGDGAPTAPSPISDAYSGQPHSWHSPHVVKEKEKKIKQSVFSVFSIFTCATLLDCSRRSSEGRWIRRNATVAHPIKLPVSLARDNPNVNYVQRVINDCTQRNCVIFGADGFGDDDIRRQHLGNEAVNLKIDQKNSLAVSSVNEFTPLSE